MSALTLADGCAVLAAVGSLAMLLALVEPPPARYQIALGGLALALVGMFGAVLFGPG